MIWIKFSDVKEQKNINVHLEGNINVVPVSVVEGSKLSTNVRLQQVGQNDAAPHFANETIYLLIEKFNSFIS